MRIHLKNMLARRSLPSQKARINVDWKRILLILMLASASESLLAMKPPEESELSVKISQATMLNKINTVRQLLNIDNDLETAQTLIKNNPTWFFRAVGFGRYEIVQFLLLNGANPNFPSLVTGSVGQLPLIVAVMAEDEPIVKLLLEYGAYASRTRSSDGVTPLMAAGTFNRTEIAKLLLTTLTPAEKKAILTSKASIPTIILTLKQATPRPPRDIRNAIKHQLIKSFVADHIRYIDFLLHQQINVSRHIGTRIVVKTQTPQDFALKAKHYELAKLLDPNNPTAREEVIAQVRANIEKLLLGKEDEGEIENHEPMGISD